MVRRTEEHWRKRRVVRIGFDTDMQHFQHTARQILHHVFGTQAEHFWPLATSLLNGALFLLIGIETRLLVVNFRFSSLDRKSVV